MVASRDPIQLLRLGRVRYRQALGLMRRLAEARHRGEIGDTLLLVEHSPVITLGHGGGMEDLLASEERLRSLGVDLVETERGGKATYHGPGQLVVYPIMRLANLDPHEYLWRLEQTAIELLAGWGIEGHREECYPGVWVGQDKIAAVGIAVRDSVTSHGIAINVSTDMSAFDLLVPCGISDRGVTSMSQLLGRAIPLEDVERQLVPIFGRVFDREVGYRREPGPWLVVNAPDERADAVASTLNDLQLHTVCEEAVCPNLGDCWARGTATFLILGNICTRGCRFCNVKAGKPSPLNTEEPARVAEAASRMGLRHVVVTSVTRDDLPDGGAGHFAATISAIRGRLPNSTVEVLVPDFGGSPGAIERVAEARPDIFGHNVETVERLSGSLRAGAGYSRSLAVLAWAGRLGMATKSGLMVGLGERCDEVVQTLLDLRRAGCELLTIGQYLQPTPSQKDVAEYLAPALFDWYGEVAREMGFRRVSSAPLVRSSYHAEEVLVRCR